MSEQQMVLACEKNYIDYWACAGASPYAQFSDDAGIVRAITGLPNEIFNVVLKCRLRREQVDDTIDYAIESFRSRRIPLLWHVGMLTEPRDLSRYLEERGFPHDYDLKAMSINLDTLGNPPTSPDRVRVECVSSVEQSMQWIKCIASSWHLPEEVPKWMARNPTFNAGLHSGGVLSAKRKMYLGFTGDKPASASMLFWTGGIAGLQMVGTMPSSQNRGVGTATVMAALRDAHDMGFSRVVVLSTVEGIRLYERVGFTAHGVLPEHSMHFER